MKIKKIISLFLITLTSLFIMGVSNLKAAGTPVSVSFTFSPSDVWNNGVVPGTFSSPPTITKQEVSLNYSSITNAKLDIYEADFLMDSHVLTFTKTENYLNFTSNADSSVGVALELSGTWYLDKFYIPFSIPAENFYILLTFNMVISDTINPVINGQTNYITNVNNPISEAEIKSGLYAIDNVDGTIPSTAFTLISDDYTSNKNILGVYNIIYKVSDSSGNESQVTVKVHVVDVDKPIISGTSTYTVAYNQTQSLTTILNNLTVADNYQSGIIPVIVHDNYTPNKTIKGSYEITYKATDSSGNESDIFTVTVTVIDNVKPVISGTSNYTRVYNNKLDLATIKAGLTANDGYDGDITANITLKSDNYTSNYNVLGTYKVIYTVKDNSNNAIDYTVTINVVDTIKPTITGQSVYNTGSTEKISESTIRESLNAIDDYDGALTIELVSNPYDSHYQEIRSHKITYKATDLSGNFTEYVVTINVFDDVPPVIYTNDAFINVDGTLNYTLQQIIQHLITVGDLEASVNFDNYLVESSTYNPELPGSYEVILTRSELASPVLKEKISVGIRVLEPNPIPTIPDIPIPDDSSTTPNLWPYFVGTFIAGIFIIAFVNRKKR